jgi:hypothetical protein
MEKFAIPWFFEAMNSITNGFCSYWRTTKGSTWRIAAGVGTRGTEIFVHLAHISWLICTHKTSNTLKISLQEIWPWCVLDPTLACCGISVSPLYKWFCFLVVNDACAPVIHTGACTPATTTCNVQSSLKFTTLNNKRGSSTDNFSWSTPCEM